MRDEREVRAALEVMKAIACLAEETSPDGEMCDVAAQAIAILRWVEGEDEVAFADFLKRCRAAVQRAAAHGRAVRN